MARKTVHKVRALVIDPNGNVYGIRADADHVLQLPGGTRKPDECPVKAIRREVREETGLKVRQCSAVGTMKIKRNGVREITTVYVCHVSGRTGKARLTKRERARGLRPCRYESPEALRAALRARVRRYGRSACRRDYRLCGMAVAAI